MIPRRPFIPALCIAACVGAVRAQDAPPPPQQPPPQQPSAPAPAAPVQTEPAPAEPVAQPAATGVTQPELDEAVLVLRDGQRVTGILVGRTPDTITLRIAGIETPFPASSVERYQVLPPVLERYQEMRAAIDPSDIQQMLRLVEWLRAHDRYELALAEIDRALAVTPGNPEALRTRALIVGQMELAAKAGKGRKEEPAPGTAPDSAPPAAARRQFPTLTPEQINLIKVFEVDLDDPPNLMIRRDAITQLMTAHAGDPLIPSTAEGRDAMYRASPASILDIMFRLQARDLYPQVQVIGQPRSMKLFSENVHRGWLMNACARCHGGEESGRLQLATLRAASEETVYTNFLILDRYRLSSGIGLMNYEDPVRSPLLQAGLPRKDALYPHPVVPGPGGRGDLWRPVFQSTRDARYRQAMEWIRSMYRPRPDYPVDYTPPGPSVQQPVEQQADGRR